MPQTLLALLAMMLTVLFSVQQQRHMASSRLDLVQDVLAIQVNGVATERLELIAAKAFDEETLDAGRRHSAGTTLTSTSGFGANEDTPENDVDDFDGYESELGRPLRDEAGNVVDTLRVDVRTSIEYVRKAATGTYEPTHLGMPSKFKRIRIEARTVNSMLPETVEITRVVSCGDSCTW